MRIFEKAGSMLGEIQRMRTAENLRREDRAIVSGFFNGQPPISDKEADDLGLTTNVNHLFGYTEIRSLRDQLVSLHTKPACMIEIELDSAPAGKRMDWSMKAQQAASEVMKTFRPFKTEYVGASGDAALHGEAVFFYGTKTFPLPRQVPLSRMLIPDGASTDPGELTHFAIEDTIKPHYLSAAYRHGYKDWKKASISRALKEIYKDIQDGASGQESDNFEELEYRAQENSASPMRRIGIPVVYFFQQRCDEDGPPYDLTIVRRYPGGEPGVDDGTADDSILFDAPKMYPKISSILHPFFMDCILGGAPKWHRVMGTGTLNYQLNIATELLINRAMQATYEGSMNLWNVKDGATREEVSRVLMRHNGVVPENMELVQNRFSPNFAGMLDMIQFFRMQGGKNARGPALNQGSNKGDVLEVQAIADQNRAASEANMGTAEWHDFYDGLLDESFSRLTNPYISVKEPGYSMVKDFQDRMEREGIPLYWLQPHNVRATAVRILGDGLRSKELAIAQSLSAQLMHMPPEKQPEASRLILSLNADSYRIGEDFFPIEQKPDASQIMRAKTENAIILTDNEPIGREADDIDEIHVPVHFKALESMITDGMQAQPPAFTPKAANSFKNLGGHILVHIKTIEGKAEPNKNDQNRQLARALTDQLTQYGALGDKLLHNMQQTQQAQQEQGEQMTASEQAKMQLAFEQLKLQREKMSFSMDKFSRQQGNREQALAFDQMLKLDANQREGRRAQLEASDTQHGQAIKELEVATKVAQANKPEPAAA